MLTVHDAGDDRVTAVLFGVGCHPVTLGWDNMAISGDFPGVAQRHVEAALGLDNALFFNSTEGNVIPATSPNRNSLDPRGYVDGTYADTERIGATIATEVVRVVSTITPSATVSLGSARRDLFVAPKNAGFDRESAQERLARATSVIEAVLGADFAERAQGYVWALARTDNAQSFVIGLADAHHRNLPMPSHFHEPDAGLHYETVTAGLEPNAMELALDTGMSLLAGLRS